MEISTDACDTRRGVTDPSSHAARVKSCSDMRVRPQRSSSSSARPIVKGLRSIGIFREPSQRTHANAEVLAFGITRETIEKSEIVGFSFARKTTIVRQNNQPVNHSYTSHILHYLSKAVYTSQRIIRLVAFMRHLSSYFYKALALARLHFELEHTDLPPEHPIIKPVVTDPEQYTILTTSKHTKFSISGKLSRNRDAIRARTGQLESVSRFARACTGREARRSPARPKCASSLDSLGGHFLSAADSAFARWRLERKFFVIFDSAVRPQAAHDKFF
ncbi:unnamed protein product [Trichogramma brassicae]|uniref:Uncharacterized protein n=1 Tax=Trichogramma brassicae TaxID=86971 RepID=A0A6H5IZA1_9HYME|nr:unnamed protein product [Trichogramma brassicae]